MRCVTSSEYSRRKKLLPDMKPVSATHEVPEPPRRFALWDEKVDLPKADDLPDLRNVEFHVIKKWDKPTDGYTFLHGGRPRLAQRQGSTRRLVTTRARKILSPKRRSFGSVTMEEKRGGRCR